MSSLGRQGCCFDPRRIRIGAAIGDGYAVKGATVVALDLAVDAAQRKVSAGRE
jgi:hypothetical protein